MTIRIHLALHYGPLLKGRTQVVAVFLEAGQNREWDTE